jgi:hypothetical protein
MCKQILCLLALILLTDISYSQCTERTYDPSTTWDWRSTTYTVNVRDQNNAPIQLTIESPWYALSSNNSNVNPFRLENPKDYEPSDGWVLIQRDFGTSANPINHPYFVLYNKYSGLLRIFVAITKVIGTHTAGVITLTYQDGSYRSAVLENHTTLPGRNALNEFNNDVEPVRFPNSYSFDIPYWMHADFVTNYDPCTCNELSQLVFDVKLLTTANLSFTANGTAQTHIDASGKSGSGARESYAKIGQGIVDAGNSFHKSTQSALDNLKSIFPSIDYAENPVYNVLPGIGAAVGVANYLYTLFGGSSAPKATVFDINLKANGDITESDSYKNVIFETPGSDNLTLIPPTQLTYNNPLGVFTLLETPQVIGSTNLHDLDDVIHAEKYKLANNISFAVNPNSGYSSYDLLAAILIEFSDSRAATQVDDVNSNLVYEGRVGDKYIWRTHYMPSSCLTDISVHIEMPYATFYPTARYVKTILTARSTDGHGGVFVSNYKVNSTWNHLVFHDAPFWPSTLSGHSYATYLHNVSIDRNWKAWGFIDVENATFSGAPSYQLIAKEVFIKPSTILTPGVVVMGALPNGCSASLAPANATAVSAICNSTSYLQRVNPAFRQQTVASDDEINSEGKNLFGAYPNPANNSVTFSYNVEQNSTVSITISDLAGRIIAAPLKNEVRETGSYEELLDISTIKSGLYIYTIEANGKRFIDRLLVNN